MAKFYGVIGYVETVETSSGVWEEQVTERKYRGDILKNMNRWQNGENLNSDFNIDNKFSIVADPFAYENYHLIRYIQWNKIKWLIKSCEIDRPRINIYIGGVYNGPSK